MSSVYEARRTNAHRLFRKMETLLESGHIIFDEHGEMVPAVYITKEGDCIEGSPDGRGRCLVMHFINNTELDNGMHTPVAEFNQSFENWKVIHPKDVKPLVLKA